MSKIAVVSAATLSASSNWNAENWVRRAQFHDVESHLKSTLTVEQAREALNAMPLTAKERTAVLTNIGKASWGEKGFLRLAHAEPWLFLAAVQALRSSLERTLNEEQVKLTDRINSWASAWEKLDTALAIPRSPKPAL